VSSNVGQNYPYTSETEEQRAAAVEAAVGQFEGLREKIQAETTPLGPDPEDDNVDGQRWWVWVCPEHDFTGRLHVAGYAVERHALYTVCDTCGKAFLR
jgi:hypothetical protein